VAFEKCALKLLKFQLSLIDFGLFGFGLSLNWAIEVVQQRVQDYLNLSVV
jgi:hypothetical protein